MIRKNRAGQTYCSWSKGEETTYFWKAGRTLVSISFTPNRDTMGKPSAEAFRKDVEKFANEVTFAEK
jgi:hypothetical protein